MGKKCITISGTEINEVKRLNHQSGLSYNEAKLKLARKKGTIKDNRAT